ncbi:MAG: hypothetical protein FIA90_03440 [candidate division NC10 bacterium]|nr:hypothetical protein [candidate division NC10 bacterium]
MITRRALLVIVTMAAFLPACTALQTFGRSTAEAQPSPAKPEVITPRPVPAPIPAAATSPAPPEEEAEDTEDTEEAEDTENAEETAPPKVIEPAPVPLPSTGVLEGAPIPLGEPGARRGDAARGVPVHPEAVQYVSLNFDNADLELVLRSIADITKINFIIGPGVKANVTMRTTTRVPSTEVFSILESVLEVNNLAAVKDGLYYKIVPIAVAQQEPQDVQVGKERTEERERYVTQIVRLDYLSADEMTKLMQPFLARGAKMLVHKETNSLIIAGFSSTLQRVLETIKALDVPTKRDNIQRIFVYFVENAKAAELANTLNTLYGRRDLVRGAVPTARPGQPGVGLTPGMPPPPAPGTGQPPPPPVAGQPSPPPGAPLPSGAEAAPGEVVGEVTIVSDETTNSLIVKTSPRNYEIIEATIKQLDIIPKQVLIELLLAQIRLTDDFNFSLEQVLRSGTILLSSINGGPAAAAVAAFKDPAGVLPPSGLTFTTFVDKEQFRLVLNNLAAVTKVEVLANPHLLTANNKEANIQIGNEVPIVTNEQASLTTLSSGGTTPSSGVFRSLQQKDIGIILKIKPHVNEKRLVTLDVEAENTAVDQASFGSTGSPSFLKTITKTAIVVEDGQSLVIGGIIRTDKSKGYSGIPFLSAIPLLGYLFRSTSSNLNRNELVILITPHVVASPEEGRALTEQFRGRVETLELLMKSSPTTSPSGLAPLLNGDKKDDPGQ